MCAPIYNVQPQGHLIQLPSYRLNSYGDALFGRFFPVAFEFHRWYQSQTKIHTLYRKTSNLEFGINVVIN